MSNVILLGVLVLSLLAATLVTWGVYLSIMQLKYARDKGTLTLGSKIFVYPWLVFWLALDIAFNLVIGTILFLEPPREVLFTSRVSRLNDDPPFDPAGRHCR